MNKGLWLKRLFFALFIILGVVLISDSGFLSADRDVPVVEKKTAGQKKQDRKQPNQFKITATEYYLLPKETSIQEGKNVFLVFTNRGREPHSMVIEDLGIDTGQVEPGGFALVNLNQPKKGRYRIICKVLDHRNRGMRADLIIG